MFNFLFSRPLATLLTVAGVAVLAPVIFPLLGFVLKPIVKPATNLYLDLVDEIADSFVDRQERKGTLTVKVDEEELRRVAEVKAEGKAHFTFETAATRDLIEKL